MDVGGKLAERGQCCEARTTPQNNSQRSEVGRERVRLRGGRGVPDVLLVCLWMRGGEDRDLLWWLLAVVGRSLAIGDSIFSEYM